MAKKIFKKLTSGEEDVFQIREMVIKEEATFSNDYYTLMRDLFDEYVTVKNASALLLISEYMHRSLSGGDQEVNFTALLFNLKKLEK